MMNQPTLCVSTVPLFNHLTASDQHKINQHITHQTIAHQEIVLSPMTESKLIILSSGRLKVYQLSPNGQEQLLRVVEPGDYVGETFIFGNENHHLYVEAVTASQVCVLHHSDFKALLLAYPEISLRLLEINADKMQQMQQQAQLLATDSIEQRLVLYLLELYKLEGQVQLEIPMKLKDLALFLATTPETISRAFRSLSDQGWLTQYLRSVKLLDIAALENFVS